MNTGEDDDEIVQNDDSNRKEDMDHPVLPGHVDDLEGNFNEGLENGKAGSLSAVDIGGDWIPRSQAEEEARERGYEAGKTIYEQNKSEDDE